MKTKIVEVSEYDFKSGDKLLLDTNIWIFIYSPNDPKDPRVKIYSQALKDMLHAKSQIHIDILIVSEFINSCARIKHKTVEREELRNMPFKKFRQSEDFQEIAEEISSSTKRILKHCDCIESDFETMEIDAIINEYAKGKYDFNDQVITQICRKRQLKLVTHDRDFQNKGVAILTANRGLLSRS